MAAMEAETAVVLMEVERAAPSVEVAEGVGAAAPPPSAGAREILATEHPAATFRR